MFWSGKVSERKICTSIDNGLWLGAAQHGEREVGIWNREEAPRDYSVRMISGQL